MTKEELIRWAKAEKDRAVGKASTESAKKIQELKDKFYEDIGINEFADSVTPIFEQAFAKYKEFYGKLDEIEKAYEFFETKPEFCLKVAIEP